MALLLVTILLTVGLALLVAEVYLLPGLNVAGLLGVGVLLGAVGVAFVTGGVLGGIATLALAVLATGTLFALVRQSGAWDRFVLQSDLRSEPALEEHREGQRARYLGRHGVAVSPLRPEGVVEVDGERVEARTEGAFVASGSRVRIVAMDRHRFFVRLADADAPAGQLIPPAA